MEYEGIELDHPLRKASWIWPGGQVYIYNQYAAFRKDFRLDQKTIGAVLYITADQLYKLYINGKYICRGPARGYQSHWPFDEIDVSEYLSEGSNWISVLAYNPGIFTFQYRHQGFAGFLCALKLGDTAVYSDKSWKMKRLSGLRPMTSRYSIQMSFQEHVTASQMDNSWIFKKNFTLDWDDAEIKKITWDDCFAYGRSPYDSVENRGIPMLLEKEKPIKRMLCTASGKCEKGYRDWENVSWGWVREAVKCEKWLQTQSSLSKTVSKIAFPTTGTNNYISFTFDAGEYLVGCLNIDIQGADGNEILDFQFHENMVNGRPAIRPEGSCCQIALANRIYLKKGRFNHEFFHILGFRYLTVVMRNSLKPITVKVKIRTANYPLKMEGDFFCSDNLINNIFSICKHTQKICSLDAYVDTPWREQAQWWGDARIQSKNTFYIDGDHRLFKRGIQSLIGQTTSQGLTYGHAPTMAGNCILPDFALTWIVTFWDYYFQTEDISLFKSNWPHVQRILSYFESNDACSEIGLIKFDKRYWYFGDWASIYRGHIPTFLNLWYLYALTYLEKLLIVAQMDSEKKNISEKISIHRKLILSYLFDQTKNQFCGGLDENFKQAGPYSVHDHVMAIQLNLIPEEQDSFAKKWVLPYLLGKNIDGALPSAFWSSYVIEIGVKLCFANETVNFIKRKWEPMLETGTTWEAFEWNEKSNESASHAWSAHPSYHFTNIITGITQMAPGWRKINFCPNFIQGLTHAKSIIPSPLGKIAASWKIKGNNFTAELSLPDMVSCEVSLPGINKHCSGGKKYEFTGKF
ncbi:MAG: alpha-L-rhamnosidase C-terminal domain-containing protein [Lentisphaerota bacterium]